MARAWSSIGGLVLVATLAAPASVLAASVVAVTDSRVAQYSEAFDAAREIIKGPVQTIDMANGGSAADALRQTDAAVILAVGQKALQAARDAAPTTPTVYCVAFERSAPGTQYVTGSPLEISADAQLSQIRQTAPSVKRIGLLYDTRTDAKLADDAQRVARGMGIALTAKGISDPKDLRAAVADLASSIDGLWLLPDPRLISQEVFSYLLVFTLERKIALFGFLDGFTQTGALASISPDYKDIGRRAAQLVNEIASRPADKRVPVPPLSHSPGALTVNLKSAQQLGIRVPSTATNAARQVFQ